MTEACTFLDGLAPLYGRNAPSFLAGIAGAEAGNLEPVQRAIEKGTERVHLPFSRPDAASPDVQTFQMEIAAAAATSGTAGLPILKWLAESRTKYCWSSRVCFAAAASGSLENLLFLRRLADPCPWCLPECARLICPSTAWENLQGDLESVGPHARESAGLWALAAQLEDAAVLRQLMSARQVYPCDPEACHVLLQNGDMMTLTRLFCDNYRRADSPLARHIIADSRNGTADLLRRLCIILPAEFWQQHGLYSTAKVLDIKRLLRSADFACPCTTQDWVEAVHQADSPAEALEELKLLRDTCTPRDQPWDRTVCEAAAYEGQLQTVEWLWGKVPAAFWDRACSKAFEGSQPEVIRWLLRQNPPCPFVPYLAPHHWDHSKSLPLLYHVDFTSRGWTILGYHSQLPSRGLLEQIPMVPHACCQAAASNNLELMMYLRRKGCPWDVHSCRAAAANRHWAMLTWLRSQSPSCPWDACTSQLAADSDRQDILLWMLTQDPPCPFPHAPEGASVRCLQLLIALGCPMQYQKIARAVCPLPVSLVLGLTRWYQNLGMQALQAALPFRVAVQAPEDDLLAHLSRLPYDLIWRICQQAGMCGRRKAVEVSPDSSNSGERRTSSMVC